MEKIAIIQARMGSTRLPGKVLKKIGDKTLLEYQVERVRRAKHIDLIVIATTMNPLDDKIEKLCQTLQLPVYRGPEHDVLTRYFEAATKWNASVIVRLTSDCPLIDPSVIDRVLKSYITKSNLYDYVSNTIKRTFPRGMDTEVFSFQALEKCFHQASEEEREHVTSYILNNPTLFKLKNVTHIEDESRHRWTVDTREDFLLIQKIIQDLYPLKNDFSMLDVLALMKRNPEWEKINQHIEQKSD